MGTLRACVDWLQVTFPAVTSVQQIVDNLGLKINDFSSCLTGLFGYKSHIRMGHISVLYDGAPDMGVHVMMTGQGCREYEVLNDIDWREFFRRCFEMDGSFTRLDGAIDDFADRDNDLYFKVATLRRKAREGAIRSRFKSAKSIRKIRLADGESIGETLYIGNPSSDIQVRVYEKDWERIAAGHELEQDITGWNRIEIQTRRDRAQALALYLLNSDNIGAVLAGVLRNYMEICVKKADTNKARWPLCDWWAKFIDDAEKLRLTMIAPDRTVEKAMKWIDRQVAPTLGMIFAATNGDINLIMQYIIDGMDRMTDQQIQLAKEYSDQLLRKQEYLSYERRNKWNEYLFKTGAHREIKKIADGIGERKENNYLQ
jgi:phage replication initiation protein